MENYEGIRWNSQVVVFDDHTPRPAVVEFDARDFLENLNAERRKSHPDHRIVLAQKVVRSSREGKIANGPENVFLVTRVGCYPDIHIDGVSDIAKRVHGIIADQEKPSVMGIEQLQELFEIGWYPGRSHSGSGG